MAIQFLNMPQQKVPGPLDFSPARNALLDYRQSMDQQHETQQNRLVGGALKSGGPRAASDLSAEQGNIRQAVDFRQFADREDDRKRETRDRAKAKVFGLAQAASEAPPELRGVLYNRLRALDPDGDAPDDPEEGLRLLLAEAQGAQGYQDPRARQMQDAELAYKRAMTQKALRPDASELKAPTVKEFYDESTGQKYKASYNHSTGEWDRVGGMASGKSSLTVGQQAVDRKFADELVDWNVRGGMADAQKQLDQLDGIADMLEDPEKSRYVSGPVEGMLPDRISAFTESGQNRIATREAVEEVVQRNLKLVLGGQFSEREGMQLIARAYNPSLPPAENARRVRRLVTQIKSAADAKQAATDYFNQHGTLTGWTGRIPTIDDFNPDGEDDRSAIRGVVRPEIDGPPPPPAMVPPSNPQMTQPQAGSPSGPDAIPLPNGAIARRAPDGNYYVEDPSRPGKYIQVMP